MSSFDDRRNAFENKFVHDEEIHFRVVARAARLFGAWAAEKMGLHGQESDNYIHRVTDSDRKDPAVIKRMVAADLQSKGVAVSSHAADMHYEECLKEAQRQIEGQ